MKKLILILVLVCMPVSAQDKHHFYKDKRWWVDLGFNAAVNIVGGMAESHAKQGGTYAFGACGTCTTNKEIGLTFGLGFGIVTGLSILNHHILYNTEPPLGPVWRSLAYEGPWMFYSVPVLYQAAGNWNDSSPPKPNMLNYQLRGKP
jgi:hypothetical protein